MKRNSFYKTLQALALLLLALATMAGAATGLDTDPDTQELYVNMPVIGLNEVEITADDIANGLTSFMVYDDGGKASNYSNGAEGMLQLTAPTGYAFLISGEIMTSTNTSTSDRLTIYDGSTDADILGDVDGYWNPYQVYSSGNVITFRFTSDASGRAYGFALKVSVVHVVNVANVDGGEVKVIDGEETSDKAKATAGETVTLTQTRPKRLLARLLH